MKGLHKLTFLLLVIGGLNWGLVGLLEFDLVNYLVGSFAPLDKLVYILVGLSAVVELVNHKATCKECSA